MEGNLFANTGDFLALRINGIYYQRVVSPTKGGWRATTESALPADIRWNQLLPVQYDVYRTALIEAKLMDG